MQTIPSFATCYSYMSYADYEKWVAAGCPDAHEISTHSTDSSFAEVL